MGTFSKRIETSVAVLLGSLYTLVTIITQRMLPVLVIHAILEIPAIYTYHMKRVWNVITTILKRDHNNIENISDLRHTP